MRHRTFLCFQNRHVLRNCISPRAHKMTGEERKSKNSERDTHTAHRTDGCTCLPSRSFVGVGTNGIRASVAAAAAAVMTTALDTAASRMNFNQRIWMFARRYVEWKRICSVASSLFATRTTDWPMARLRYVPYRRAQFAVSKYSDQD